MVKANKPGKIIYLASILMVLLVQVLTASRRGFIIALAFCMLAVFFAILPRYTKKYSVRRLAWVTLLLLLIAVAIVYLGSYILYETALGIRLSGKFISGDSLRDYYKLIARQQFSKHPVLGVGLNGLKSVMGVYSHSLYYETLACTGVVGAIVLFTTLLLLGKKMFMNIYKVAPKHPDKLYISRLSFFFFLSAVVIAGLAVTMIYDFWFYICIAILVAVAAMSKEK
jgi:O-antigen ligase